MKIDIRAKQFGDTQVLGPISLEVDTGETVALTGPSGIGKTTLVRLIAGLDRNFDGQIKRGGRVGFVFQEPTLLPWRNLTENITIARMPFNTIMLDGLKFKTTVSISVMTPPVTAP